MSGQPVPPSGSFVWHELNSPDPARAEAFFGALLGWTFTHKDMGELGSYTVCSQGGLEIAGMMKMEGPMWDGIPPHWMNYIAVADIEASVAKVAELGGEVCVPPFDVPDVGRMTVIKDPTGAAISLIQLAPQG
ncbi:VOC family protein [Niveispirillum sp. KHB5.9]|uniref:VOC family protein n=1 Tax=Niveispirillum sp. KHB5.9 TaxID=3400269 RepID=UPI003A841BC7